MQPGWLHAAVCLAWTTRVSNCTAKRLYQACRRKKFALTITSVHCCSVAGARVGGSSAPHAAADGAADPDGQAGTAEAGEPSGAALQAVLGGGVARIVFANAVAARPDDIELRRRFLDAFSAFQLPGQPGRRFKALTRVSAWPRPLPAVLARLCNQTWCFAK